MATFLNQDPRFIIGQERYRRIRGLVEPFLFREELLFNPTERETSWARPWREEHVFPGSPADYRALRRRWQGGGVAVLGDKAPYYHRVLDHLAEAFPGAVFVFLVRDLHAVAASYLRRAQNPEDHWPADNDHRLALNDWNEALSNARAFVQSGAGARLHVVRYESFHAGHRNSLEALYRSLGLEVTPSARSAYASLVREHDRRASVDRTLDAAVSAFLTEGQDSELKAWAREAAG